jgi:hypothetical protein
MRGRSEPVEHLVTRPAEAIPGVTILTSENVEERFENVVLVDQGQT